jgi:tetratricopeptide (TPR) repeat protein
MVIFWLITQVILLVFDGWLFMTIPGLTFVTISGHIIASLLYSLSYGRSLSSVYPRQAASLLGGILAFFLPVIGMCCAFVVALLILYKPLPAGDLIKEYKKHIDLSDVIIPKKKSNYVDSRTNRSTPKVEPLVDMLSTTDSQIKRTVLDAIAKRNNSKMNPLILAAVEDPRTEIYQYAIAKAEKLKHDYELKIIKATEEVRKAPGSVKAHYRLALSYSDYIRSGLIDRAVVEFYKTQFLKEYKKILGLSDFRIEENVLGNLGAVSFEIKRWEEAEMAFRRILAMKPNSLRAHFNLTKVYYEQRKCEEMYGQIRRIQNVISTDKKRHTVLKDLMTWWLAAAD